MHHGGSDEACELSVTETGAHAGRQRDALLLEHRAELGVLVRVELAERVERDAVGDAVVQPEHDAQASGERVHDSDVARGDRATTEVRRDHQPFARRVAHHVVREEHLPAQIDRLARVGVTDRVAVRTGKRLNTVDVCIHAGVEVLVARHG